MRLTDRNLYWPHGLRKGVVVCSGLNSVGSILLILYIFQGFRSLMHPIIHTDFDETWLLYDIVSPRFKCALTAFSHKVACLQIIIHQSVDVQTRGLYITSSYLT